MKSGPLQKYQPPDHPKVNRGKVGVLLMNLGTPEATSYWPMRRYLKEFLSDRRVIETNPVLWWFILNGIILTLRPQKSGKAYEKIWNKALNESPLKTITRGQSDKLQEALKDRPEIIVDWAMRYGQPAGGCPHRGPEGTGLRADPVCAALSAIQCRDHCDGVG